jgi:hypothetical protein
MKRCVISAIILIVIASSIILNGAMLKKTSSELLTSLDEVAYSIDHNNTDKTKYYASEFYEEWHNNKPYLSAVIKHDEIDNIEFSIEKIIEYINISEKTEVKAEIAVLTFLLEHINSSQLINVENVF